ncbi:hypothetical protein A3715_06560 [Oleiphilus sp. HI0009]|nr:hypothetical protein A3715_06560 [Oleiphilus sp. HI0009]
MSESKAFCVDWGIGNKWSTLRPFALIAVTNCDFIYLLIVFIFNLLAEAASFNHYFSILLFEHNAKRMGWRCEAVTVQASLLAEHCAPC